MGAVALAQGATVFFLPESPRWLVHRGRCNEAVDVLRRLMGEKGIDTVRSKNKAELDTPKCSRHEQSTSSLHSPNASFSIHNQVGNSLPLETEQVSQIMCERMSSDFGSATSSCESFENSAVEQKNQSSDPTVSRVLTAKEIVDQINEEVLREKLSHRMFLQQRKERKKVLTGSDPKMQMASSEHEIATSLSHPDSTSTNNALSCCEKFINQCCLSWIYRDRILIAVGCAVAQNLTVSVREIGNLEI